MTKITLNNSVCQVSGMPTKAKRELKEYLTYTDQNLDYQYFKNVKALKRLKAQLNSRQFDVDQNALQKQFNQLKFMTDKLDRERKISLFQNDTFPSGLLPRVLDWLYEHGIEHEVIDERVEPKKNSVKLLTKKPFPDLRYYQKEAVKNLEIDGRGIVVLSTGTGKTVTAAKMIWNMGVTTLIITPSKSITAMMKDTMIEYFGSGSVDVLKTKIAKIKKPINIVNIQALINIPPQVFENIDAVVIDEFHHVASTTYQEVNLKHLRNAYYRIGLTATPFRNDGADLALEGVLSEILYEYSPAQAIKDGYLVKPEFRIIDNKIRGIENERYQGAYKKGIVLNKERNAEIAEIAKEHARDQVIILVKQIEHGEELVKLLPEATFINGKEKDDVRNKMLNDFRKGKIKLLIGTSVIGEGVDLPCANVLIMGGGGKAKSEVMQNVGRVLRISPGKTSAMVYDFADIDSGYLQEHSLERKSIYKIYD